MIEAPGGGESFEHGGWAFEFDRGAEGDRFKLEELQKADALLLGRGTYQGFADAWPSRTDEAGFANKLNSMPKYVVSTTPVGPDGVIIITYEPAAKTDQGPGGDSGP